MILKTFISNMNIPIKTSSLLYASLLLDSNQLMRHIVTITLKLKQNFRMNTKQSSNIKKKLKIKLGTQGVFRLIFTLHEVSLDILILNSN